jgi:hypothetical protein
VGIDAMSKYVEAWPTPKLDSATMAQFFRLFILANHGLPKTVITDQGKEFQLLFADLMKELGVKHIHSAAYNPQSNGQAEAAVKTVLHGLQKTVGSHPHSWDEHLPQVLLGLRSAAHSTTGFSPFFINTGRHPVLPAERRLATATAPVSTPSTAVLTTPAATAPPGPSSSQLPVAPARARKRPSTAATAADPANPPALTTPAAAAAAGSEFSEVPLEAGQDDLAQLLDPGTRVLLKQRQVHREATYKELRDNVLRSQAKQRVDYAKRHHGPAPEEVMPPNSLVLMWVPPQNKLSKVAACEGPYRLVEYTTGSQAIIEDAKGQRWSVAISRLAPYCK